jgi:hypothetical protein
MRGQFKASSVTVRLVVLAVFLFSTAAFAAYSSPAESDEFLGLTAAQLLAKLGQPTSFLAKGPYSFEYALARLDTTLAYRFRLESQYGEPRVVECFIDFDEPVPLAKVPIILPEASVLLEADTAFSHYELPLRSYARDVLIFAYPVNKGASGAGDPVAIMLLPASFGLASTDITRETLIRGVVISRHSPYPSEQVIESPFL